MKGGYKFPIYREQMNNQTLLVGPQLRGKQETLIEWVNRKANNGELYSQPPLDY